MRSAEEFRWLDTPDAQNHWQSLWLDQALSLDAILKRLRNSLPPEQASLLMEQYELASIARKKVASPECWFWTRQLLEQASDEETAQETAADFPRNAKVVDLCCGAGADAIAMRKIGLDVNAVDRCPVACHLTKRNANAQLLDLKVIQNDAERVAFSTNEFVHIDPDRRADGSRITSLSRLSPTWNSIRKMLDSCSGMSLKLAPGLRIDWNHPSDTIDRIPESIRFISKEGSVRQQRWYWGLNRWPNESVTCSMLLNQPALLKAQTFHQTTLASTGHTCLDLQRAWFHETFLKTSFSTSQRAAGPLTNAVDTYIGDYDPSLRAAECGEIFASRYGFRLLGTNSGYFTSTQPLVHPMVRWFRVVDLLPLDRKQIKVYSKQARVRSWELKSRGIDVDLDAMRKLLSTDKTADAKGTILFTHFNKHHQAVVCEEV